MDNKDCMFQFWACGKMVEDTGLIAMTEATELFDKYKYEFKDAMESGDEPALALWINNTESSQYQESKYNWQADDFLIIGGLLYEKVGI